MPSIRHELETTRTARWYREARCVQRGSPWEERVRCYAALFSILAEEAGARRPPHALLTRVARRANFASAEPVYRRWRGKQDGQPVARWAGPDPSVKPANALVAEAKITAFWPYREGVIQVADAFDMTAIEWAAAYYRALAAWVGDHRTLAACRPASPPGCAAEDLAVLVANPGRACGANAGPASACAARLHELAGAVVRHVLDDGSITPLGAFDTIRGEVQHLLAAPHPPLADRVICSVAGLGDLILHQSGESIVTADQGGQILSLLDGLRALLTEGER